jgi:hypothetical protein
LLKFCIEKNFRSLLKNIRIPFSAHSKYETDSRTVIRWSILRRTVLRRTILRWTIFRMDSSLLDNSSTGQFFARTILRSFFSSKTDKSSPASSNEELSGEKLSSKELSRNLILDPMASEISYARNGQESRLMRHTQRS